MEHSASGSSWICVDGHAHLHPSFDLEKALDAAIRHASDIHRETSTVASDRILLCLAAPPGDNPFPPAVRDTVHSRDRRWRFLSAQVNGTHVALRDDGARVGLIPGRQVTTSEGLEVLAVATSRRLDADETLRQTLNNAIDLGAIPIIPWGFGKWWLRRRHILESILTSDLSSCIWLGDSANRPLGWSSPLLRRARREGVPVLPGSDPLPVSGQERRLGKYGFLTEAFPLSEAPSQRLRYRLLDGGEPPFYGRRDSLIGSVAAQIRLRTDRLLS